jgi:predicted nucleic acid-binding protein
MPYLSLYLDSSVWNCQFNDHVPFMQARTQELFSRIQMESGVQVYVSDVVLQELLNAPSDRMARLAELIRGVDPIRLDLQEESAALANAYIQHRILTSGHLVDARHVAIATVEQLDALVSWNYRHLVNRRRREAFNGVNAIMGYRPIDIVSPPEVFDE